MFNHKFYPQLKQQKNFTAFVCSTKSVSGWAAVMMLPVAWGWKISESGLTPIQTDLLPAPEDLLKVIRCGCTADCGIVVCDVAAGKMGLNVLWLAVIVKV